MNEITTIEKMELKNSKLARRCEYIISAVKRMGAANWDVAKHLFNIKSEKLYADDFKTFSEFAKEFGMNPGQAGRYANAYALMTTKEEIPPTWSVTNVIELLTLKPEDVSEFMLSLKASLNEETIAYITAKDLRSFVKEYKRAIEATEFDVIEEAESEPVESEPVESELVESKVKEDLGNVISFNEKRYYEVPDDLMKVLEEVLQSEMKKRGLWE